MRLYALIAADGAARAYKSLDEAKAAAEEEGVNLFTAPPSKKIDEKPKDEPDYWFVTDNPAPTRVYLVLSGVKKDKKSTELEVNGYCGAFVNKAEAEERSALRRKNLDVLDGAEVKELQKAMSFFVQEATVI